MRSPSAPSLPTLSNILRHFAAAEEESGEHDLEWAVANKDLSRDNFYREGAWAILVSGVKADIAKGWWEKAEQTGFPLVSSGWQTLGDWGDPDFEGWCRIMATELARPQADLSGRFRDKWWWIWDLGWYLSQFENDTTFQAYFFDGKTQGHDLTDADVRRLAEIKRNERPRLGGIAEANRYFILRNLGGDFLKPDVWINQFCVWYGNVDVPELAGLLREENIHCGEFDAYCWAYCVREVVQTRRLAAHFNARFNGAPVADEMSESGSSVAEFEHAVWEVEHIRIVIRDDSNAAVSAPYNYQRAAASSDTVAKWLYRRVSPLLNAREVVVLKGDGEEPVGQTILSTVRSSYSS